MRKIHWLAAIPVAAVLGGGGAAAQSYSFASPPQGTINFFQISALAKVIQQKTGMSMRVAPLRGTHLTLSALNAAEAEFNLGSMPEVAEAYEGRGKFKGKPLKNLRVVYNHRPLTIGLFVRKDSGITSLSQLKGKRMPTGWKAFPQSELYINTTLKTVGLSLADMEPVPVADLIRAGDDSKEGKTDAGTFALEAPAVREIDSAVGGIRWLSIPEGPGVLSTDARL
jgi:TRAP transporter TAXI family solute receptor